MNIRYFYGFMVVLGMLGCARTPPPPECVETEALVHAVLARLELMPQVAQRKWEMKQPIEDPVREAEVLKTTEGIAQSLSLDTERAKVFLIAQMNAAKQVQRECMARWENGTPPSGSVDLPELRQKLNDQTRPLLETYQRFLNKDRTPEQLKQFQNRMQAAGYSQEVIRIATTGWLD